MNRTYYKITNIFVDLAEDTYENGCGDSEEYWDEPDIVGNSKEQCIERFCHYFEVPDKDELFYNIPEVGCIEYQFMATKGLNHATAEDVLKWREKKKKLYAATVTGKIMRVTEELV